MTYKNKKIYLIFGMILVLLIVILLYPNAKELLQKIRSQNNVFVPNGGKEIIYSFIDKGDVHISDQILQNKYELSRFNTVDINSITWNEDPFSDIYWRFNFYNLEPVRNLLYSWGKTNNPIYKEKLIEIINSFIDKGMKGPYSWDYHGTAFRTMNLIYVYEKLLKKNELSEDLNIRIVKALKVHGDFLADPSHFEKDYNHGLDQSVALYLLAVNFPNMQNADKWLSLSKERISELLTNIVDDDGVLVENSPYYHFYVLEKLWEINKYLKVNHLYISNDLDNKINKMISYGVYILQPNLEIPTIGASLARKIDPTGIYEEMAKSNPDLLYVLTKGKKGTRPSITNVQYPVSGETIMRSGWGKDNDFINQMQLIFDIGDYRTNHSDLDALSFSLYSKGLTLMPDVGLYTYESGPYRTYFHGTRAHNTVVVDGEDQNTGLEPSTQPKSVFAGFFKEGNGYVYQSGGQILNNGVSHKRAITMIEDSTILILDNLKSSSFHTYEQMFHLFPGAKITTNGLTLTAKGDGPEQILNIRQFITNGVELHATIGQNNPLDGFCSFQYKVAVPCYSVSYAQKGKDVSYITVINTGKNISDIKFDKDILTVKTNRGEYNININETKNVDKRIEAIKKFDISQIYSEMKPAKSLNLYSDWQKIIDSHNIIDSGIFSINTKENSLNMFTPKDGTHLDVAINTKLDLSNQNIYFKFKIDNSKNLQGFDLSLSNDNWKKYSKIEVKTFIPLNDDNQNGKWIQFGVAKGDLRKNLLGNWNKNESDFDWSKVDSVKLAVTSKIGQSVSVDIKDFSLVPDQKEARVIIVFDDGWSSVLDAAKIMNKYKIKGNVAVITNSVEKKRYLTLDNLKTLQNNYGWNIVSHSNLHKDAIKTYINNNDTKGLDADIRDALQYLIQNNINSAPNWYIYPDGSTDSIVEQIINKYYKFARSTIAAPALFPFANQFEAGVLSVYSDRTEPIDVHNAVSDAIKYHQTLFLMFHKFSKGSPSTYTEYSLGDFDEIINDIEKQGVKVITLSEFDNENNIPKTEFILHNAEPEQFSLDITSIPNTNTNKIQNVIMDKWKEYINH